MNKYNQILEVLKSYSYLGEKKFEDGTHLIGKAPHIAPLAWLHFIYAPLSDDEIKELENDIGLKIPLDYELFLKTTNGLRIFNTMSLYGFRSNYKRTVDDALQQPFSIITPNTLERSENAGENIFYIGGYSSGNGAWLYIDTDTNAVHMCKRWKVKSLYQWNNFEEMLESEIKRLITLFDKQGRKLNEKINTLPV